MTSGDNQSRSELRERQGARHATAHAGAAFLTAGVRVTTES